MDRLDLKRLTSSNRQRRVRKTLSGTADRPRLVVSISNLHVTAQLIDDVSGKTLAYATTIGSKTKGNLTEKASVVGEEVAKKAQKINITKIVFDRAGMKYHGRVKALADKARSEGLEF